ncbi:MAG: MlaD family protein [Candidatus Omnitrophota bacterium]
MAKTLTNEVKTGFMVMVCLIILIGFTVSVGRLSVFQKQYRIKAVFSKVAGVENDSPVRLCGVEIGKVESVGLLYKDQETKVEATLLLDKDAKPREDSRAFVTTLGLMGEKYIELSSGSKGAAFLKPGSTIQGEEPLQMEDLFEAGKKIASEVETTLGDISRLARHLDELVVENREDIDEVIGNIKRTTANFEEFSADIKSNPWKLMIKSKEEK